MCYVIPFSFVVTLFLASWALAVVRKNIILVKEALDSLRNPTCIHLVVCILAPMRYVQPHINGFVDHLRRFCFDSFRAVEENRTSLVWRVMLEET